MFVPLYNRTSVVNEAELYVVPLTVVEYDAIVADSCPDAVMLNARVDLDCTSTPQAKHVAFVSAYDTDTVGDKLFGTDKVIVFVLVPTTVLPLYVVQVNVQVPLAEFGICEASVVGGVHDTDALLVLVTIVPVAEPN